MFKELIARVLPKKEAILNKEAILEDFPKSISQSIYPKEVLEIHNSFDTAAENILEEAKNILKEAETKDFKKLERLESLGFKQSKQVVELKPFQAKANLSKEQIELVHYYQKEYPFNKFITEEQVKEICHKYNLVCGDVDRFKGFVPEKNLKEIESFKLKSKEKNVLIASNGLIFENAEIRPAHYTTGYFHIYKKGTNLFCFQSQDGEDFYGGLRDNPFNLEIKHEQSRFIINDNKLKICAPVKDMDISGLELKEGYKLEKKHIPDPVVLQPVRGGYLVLAKWGQEANDPILANGIDN